MLFLCFFQGPAAPARIGILPVAVCLLTSARVNFFSLLVVVVKCCYLLGFHPRYGGSLGVFCFFLVKELIHSRPQSALDRGKKKNLNRNKSCWCVRHKTYYYYPSIF